jgi:hypothetical protein
VKLRKDGPGRYLTEDGRFLIDSDLYETECEHPMCERLHQAQINSPGDRAFRHSIYITEWAVWDVAQDDYATGMPENFPTKRQAVAWLEEHLARS